MGWPTTDDPRTEFVTLRLTRSEMDALNLYADSRGLSRSEASRDAVFRVIQAEQRRAARNSAKVSNAPGLADHDD